MATAGDPCTTADGRSGYLLASGDKLVCEVQGPAGPESVKFYSVGAETQTATATATAPATATASDPASDDPAIVGTINQPWVQQIMEAFQMIADAVRPFTH